MSESNYIEVAAVLYGMKQDIDSFVKRIKDAHVLDQGGIIPLFHTIHNQNGSIHVLYGHVNWSKQAKETWDALCELADESRRVSWAFYAIGESWIQVGDPSQPQDYFYSPLIDWISAHCRPVIHHSALAQLIRQHRTTTLR